MHTDIKTHSLSTSVIITTGILALAVAMGIGRFAFTPLLPLMLRGGTIEGDAAHYWASANYLGYLLGALTAARLHRHTVKGLTYGLLGTALMTLALGWVDTTTLALIGAMLPFSCSMAALLLIVSSHWLCQQPSAST
ncbi:YbfB/YjiJ family MFS transporter [Marinobacterium maritimum]